MQPAPSTKPLIISVNAGCEALGIGRNSLYNLIESGEIETVRIFGRTLLRMDSVEALVQRGGTKAPPPARKKKPDQT